MVEPGTSGRPTVAQVDQLIDENGAPVALPEDTPLEVSLANEESIGGTGPTNWWRMGLIGLGIVAAILLIFQLLLGNTSTDAPAPAPQENATPQ